MMLEIQVLALVRSKNVAGLNQLMGLELYQKFPPNIWYGAS